jgi:hypothetical protein
MTLPYAHPQLSFALDHLGPIIVIGMHRSGTTLLSTILSELGVQMGREQERNKESICFLATNDVLLRTNGAHWANPAPFLRQLSDQSFLARMSEVASETLSAKIKLFGDVEPGQQWGWKDPRTTLTLPIWLKLFPNAKVVHIVRDGVDVALSLKRRAMNHYLRPRVNDTERMFPLMAFVRGYLLWEIYLRCAADYSRGVRTHQLRYEDLLADPVDELSRLVSFLNLSVKREHLSAIALCLVGRPRQRSLLESLWVRLLFSLRVLDTSWLSQFGYTIHAGG